MSYKLHQILKKWRRQLVLKKSHSFSDASGRTGGGSAHPRRSISMPSARDEEGGSSRGTGKVPAGHLAVYVGEEKRRFVIKTWYLNHPLFRALLKKTEEEIGFQQEGALALPCEVPFFEHLLRIIHSCKSHHHNYNIITSLLHNSSPPHHHFYPLADHEQYQELLLQLLQSSHLPHYSLSTPLCNLTSLHVNASQAVVS